MAMRGSFEYDAFISFDRRDTDSIRPVVTALRASKLNVYWCDEHSEGRWDLEIEEKLRTSRRILSFITENVDENPNDYVFAEIEWARNEDRLIPIIIGSAGRTYAIRALTARQKSYFFPTLVGMVDTPEYLRLVTLCGGEPDNAPDESTQLSADERVERWFARIENEYSESEQDELFALALAISVFECGPFVDVDSLARELNNFLTSEHAVRDEKKTVRALPRRRGPLLKVLEAETDMVRHPLFGTHQEVVRFSDRERSVAYLMFAWREFGDRRSILRKWLAKTAKSSTVEARVRLGLAIGLLAQQHFVDVFQQIIHPWLYDDSKILWTIADIALSVAAFDPAAADAVRKRIRTWTESGSDNNRRVAIRLACGFAGSRLPGIAIETLRTAADYLVEGSKQRWPLLETMKDAMNDLLHLHHENPDNSLFDLHGLVDELARWALEEGEPTDTEKLQKNPYPMYLVLLVLSELPIDSPSRVRGSLSLETLMDPRGGTANTAERTARIFNKAMSAAKFGGIPTRRLSQDILRNWITLRRRTVEEQGVATEIQSKADNTIDPLLTLARYLVATAGSPDDEDRVTFMFDSIFTEAELRHLTHSQLCPNEE